MRKLPLLWRCGLIFLAGVLMLVLCLVFFPWGIQGMVFGSLLIVLLTALGYYWAARTQSSLSAQQSLWMAELPGATFRQPVVLVCGDGVDVLFGEAAARITTQGCYLRVGNETPLLLAVQALLAQRPSWGSQLAVLRCVIPEMHTDEAVLRAELKRWRQQVGQLRASLGRTLPVAFCSYLQGIPSPWFISQGGHAQAEVWTDEFSGAALPDWLTAGKGSVSAERAAQTVGLAAAGDWFHKVILAECSLPDALSPICRPVALAVQFTPMVAAANNVWQRALQRRTTLTGLVGSAEAANPGMSFPDPLLPLLARAPGRSSRQRALGAALGLFTLFALAALYSVAWNNQRLIVRMGADLQRYYAIPATQLASKISAVEVLRADAQLLERYHRDGEPLQLGLGLYPGKQLYIALLTAVDGYVPPVEDTKVAQPETVRLDSLSLFDTGQSRLKPDSTRVLVQALINIKAKPGWLILVSGHTDATGLEQANQELSLKRAEAVRDWMLQTSDVPATCFAVQGYGATRPLASNDSVAGRAANRRVEISLVPQASACQVPEAANRSPQQVTSLSKQ